MAVIKQQFVPREWEWIALVIAFGNFVRVCPTLVGMNRQCGGEIWITMSLSHASGNESDVNNYVEIQPVVIPRGGNESYQRELFSERIRLVPHTWEWIELVFKVNCSTFVIIPREWEWVGERWWFIEPRSVYPTCVGMSRRLKKTVWCILLPYTLVEVNCTMIN